jgi:hypothetical protein
LAIQECKESAAQEPEALKNRSQRPREINNDSDRVAATHYEKPLSRTYANTTLKKFVEVTE